VRLVKRPGLPLSVMPVLRAVWAKNEQTRATVGLPVPTLRKLGIYLAAAKVALRLRDPLPLRLRGHVETHGPESSRAVITQTTRRRRVI